MEDALDKIPSVLHDPADRYHEMRKSASSFVINQFGLSAFIWNPTMDRWVTENLPILFPVQILAHWF